MAWGTPKWINFWDTDTYDTLDGADEVVFANNADTGLLNVPTTLTLDGDSWQMYWDTNLDGERNRNASNISKLAGMQFAPNAAGAPRILAVQLRGGVGNWRLRLASGDPDGVGTTQPYIRIFDGATLRTIIDGTSGRANFMDATGVNRTNANFAANNQPITLAFADTSGPSGTPIMYVELGNTATAGYTMINTLMLEYLGGAAAASLIVPAPAIAPLLVR